MSNNIENTTIEEINNNQPKIIKTLEQLQHLGKWEVKFGKHKGKTYNYLLEKENKYLKWVVDKKVINNDDLNLFLKYKLNIV